VKASRFLRRKTEFRLSFRHQQRDYITFIKRTFRQVQAAVNVFRCEDFHMVIVTEVSVLVLVVVDPDS